MFGTEPARTLTLFGRLHADHLFRVAGRLENRGSCAATRSIDHPIGAATWLESGHQCRRGASAAK